MRTKVLVLLMCTFLLGWIGIAKALPITDLFIDVGFDYDGDNNTTTGLFDTFVFEDQAQSKYNVESREDITIGTTFVDYGNVIVTHLRSGLTYLDNNDEDMRHGSGDTDASWELTITWTDLTGEVVDIQTDSNGNTIASAKYTGGIFTMYFDTNIDANFGVNIGRDDDSGFNNGTIIIEAKIIPGPQSTGTATIYSGDISRDVSLLLEITNVDSIQTPPVLSSNTYDLESLVGKRWLLAMATEAGASGNLIWSDENDGDNVTILSGSGTGSFQLHAVPEPATILLVGSGLFAAGFLTRKRFKK